MSDTQSVEEISLSEARAENIGLQDEGNREATSDIQSRATATDAVSSSTPVNEGSGSAVVSLSRVNPSVARTAVSSGSSITRPNFMTLNSFPNEPPPPYPHSDRRLLNFSSPHVPLAENNSTEQRRMTHNITRIRNIDETENVQLQAGGQSNYGLYMSASLCLMVFCVLNFPSLTCIIPALICSWKAVQASYQRNFQVADRYIKVTQVLYFILGMEFTTLVVSLIYGIVLISLGCAQNWMWPFHQVCR